MQYSISFYTIETIETMFCVLSILKVEMSYFAITHKKALSPVEILNWGGVENSSNLNKRGEWNKLALGGIFLRN